MTITITAAYIEAKNTWFVFKPDADLSEYDPADLDVWDFEALPRTTGTLLKTNETIDSFGLPKDNMGGYGAAYSQAYVVATVMTHAASWRHAGTTVEKPTRDDVEALPPHISSAFAGRIGSGGAVTDADLEGLKAKKQKKAASPAPTSGD